MQVISEKIRDLSFEQIGWRFYPITYKDKKYVVEIKLGGYKLSIEDYYVYANVFAFNEKKKLFRGHKGKVIFKSDMTKLQLNDRTYIDVLNISEAKLKIRLPELMKFIFFDFEEQMKRKSEEEQMVREVEKWDGVISANGECSEKDK